MSFVGPRPERPEFVAELTQSDSVLRAAARRAAGPDRLGAGAPPLRGDRGGRAGEAAVRPLLHQAHVDRLRLSTSSWRPSRPCSSGAGRRRWRTMLNAMTVDVEDYFQVSAFDELRVAARTGRRTRAASAPTPIGCSSIFDEAGVHATFFVLGWVAERFPELVRRIQSRGPRAGLAQLRPRAGLRQARRRQFRADLRRAQSGNRASLRRQRARLSRARATRSPSDRCGRSTSWSARAITYDSSIYPIRHDRYGIPGWPRHIHRIERGWWRVLGTARLDDSPPGHEPADGWRRLFPVCCPTAGRSAASDT